MCHLLLPHAPATIPIGGGSANVYVNLTPAVNVGQNLRPRLPQRQKPPHR
ncbi:fimbrial protein, partial [Klebsiella pneumoniae]|nr:fimbrial protein [Klebsiella pneumoniae]